MPGYLTTHVLDTARGVPAAGLKIDLYRVYATTRTHLAEMVTNEGGRTDKPILPAADFAPGTYELVFHVADYLATAQSGPQAHPFLDEIPIRFKMSEKSHYHVPLLLSPYGYSTYRGS
ncbi:MAG: hydroxyisourate hydrolase [Litoreibacter sp.]|nr:hydroxyisourate hydrolase [Litoreibacter sp.]